MKQIQILITLFLLSTSFVFAQGKYDIWLKNEGFYLLTSDEKKKFAELTDDQKEAYIQNLWAALDPNPITAENEFQIEYLKRYEYAKKHFQIPSDRAKIYMLLGAPNTVERHHNSDKYFPLELWSYYSLGFPGLPPSLDLIFFRRWGSGDFRLYSPLFDGFKALTPSQMNFDSQRTRAQIKQYFDPQIVQAAEQMSTGVGANASEEVRMILTDPRAIRRLEKKRPDVETTIVYEGFDADLITYSVPHRDGTFRTSVATTIPPKYVTFEKTEEKYQARIDITGKVIDGKGNEIAKINDSPALSFNDAQFREVSSYYLTYQFDLFLLPGKYSIDLLFRDYASNSAGKISQSFEIQETTDDIDLIPLLIAYKGVTQNAEAPYTYNNLLFAPKENGTLQMGQMMVLYSMLQNPQRKQLDGIWALEIGLRKDGKDILALSENLPVSTSENLHIARKMALQSLVPGEYSAFMRLSQGEMKFESEAPLKITNEEQVLGRLRIVAPLPSTPETYHTNVALQYFLRKDLNSAAKHARIAMDLAPSSYTARSLMARIDEARGDAGKAIAAYESLVAESPADSEGHFLIGKWATETKDWQKASQNLRKAMELGYYTTELLNILASAELQLGNTQEAIVCWEKSLALNSNQPEVQQLLAQHKK